MLESLDVKHIGDLKPDPHNRRKHNPRNIGMIVDALHQVGAARSIVVDEDNIILAGNGVIEAAAQAGIERVRVIEADGNEIIAVKRTGLTEEQKRKLALFDNRTAELAEWDAEQIAADLEAGLDFDGLFTEDELDKLIGQDGHYTRKIESPIYEPSGDKPPVSALLDDGRARELEAEIIASSDLTEDERAFLLAASKRHIVFNYEQIANYYAQSSAPVQRLMENSALVIIDFDRAMELGFVELSTALAEQVARESDG